MSLVADTFPLAEELWLRIADDVAAIEAGASCGLLERVTPTTARLLRHWFARDIAATRMANFHAGQRDAILAVVYAHEVVGADDLLGLYERIAPARLRLDGLREEVAAASHRHPKYAVKMATGTGKTWVLAALLAWQYLNAVAAPHDPRFTRNVLIVAPGLIVYDRLRDAFLGRPGADGLRDPTTSDLAAHADLFLPEDDRATVLSFLASSVVEKQDIGRAGGAGGFVALTNWHVLAEDDADDDGDDGDEDGDDRRVEAAGVEDPRRQSPGLEDDRDADARARAAAASLLPLSPGSAAGNDLMALDRRARRGEALQWLAYLPDLLVFNDEAHHVHALRRGETNGDVQWQRALTRIAARKGRRFTQVDFSATPYNEARGRRRYFPHIISDFDLLAAMRSGIVKSLTLDRRQEVAALGDDALDFAAERDVQGRVTGLSAGQRTMLRAGLRKLRILEEQFAHVSPARHPKLLVLVEDTEVSGLVEDFLLESGLAEDDVVRVDSRRRTELGEREWERVRMRLSGIDARPTPRVIVSVLMLREGFDVDSICVIVPLRSARSGILLEQTIGRGLRLMWRGDPAIDELKAQTRERIAAHRAPENYFDVLFVIEHPRFVDFYVRELGDGLVGEVGDVEAPARGDSIEVRLRPGFEPFDFAVPILVREPDTELVPPAIDVAALPVSRYPLETLVRWAGRGERFVSQDVRTSTRFGPYRVSGASIDASGYNEYLAALAMRVLGAVSRTFTTTGALRQGGGAGGPVLHVHRAALVRALDRYVRSRLFGAPFDPLEGERWRVLLIGEVTDELAATMARALVAALETRTVGAPEVTFRRISEVPALTVRLPHSVALAKCVYPRVPVPAVGGGLERLFARWADEDAAVEAIVKVDERRHPFLARPYLKADGMPALYSPDFLVRTPDHVYVVETKAQSALSDENVRRKQEAARAWCARIAELPSALRDDRTWTYVLLGEGVVRDWHARGARASELLAFTRRTEDPFARDDALFP